MVIVDTAVWIDHIRKPSPTLADLLSRRAVGQHPMVTLEIALGSIGPRIALLDLLRRLPPVPTVTDEDMLDFLETSAIFGTGIGYVDAHLLGAASMGEYHLWTHDRRLAAQADKLGLAFSPA